jgi:serine/threonine protein kinase
MADAGETTLADRVKPLPVDELLELAVELARAVGRMHHCGVMHRDITPANVVVSGDGVPTLVDFALATPLAETRPAFTHHSRIVGTLAYLAPEQTGRTGRSVDQRADLYALGATLYELGPAGATSTGNRGAHWRGLGTRASNPPRRHALIHRSSVSRDTRTRRPAGSRCSAAATARTSRPRARVDRPGSAASRISP